MAYGSETGMALVTGASTGIGAVYADRLARRGYDLILVARDEARLGALAARLEAAHGVKAEVLAADLTNDADVARVERRLSQDEAISLLVNNAGMAEPRPLIEADMEKVQAMIALNVVAVTRLAAAAARGFVARGRGAVVNISSVLALAPERFSGTYSGTKAYVLNLTLSMQQELGAKGVRLQAVLPGATRTEIWARSGIDVNSFPPEMIMDVDEMVDAALAGFDQGEVVTIPSLPDAGDWARLNEARLALGQHLSRDRAAARYKMAVA